MGYKIKCYTLFDITKTGVPNRPKPIDETDIDLWIYKRNTQANFDTILQAISLRSQPENISNPYKILIDLENFQKFGFLLYSEQEIPCWVFEFEVQHPSVFEDGIKELGFLYNDCDEIPMIKCKTEYYRITTNLDTTPECKNIYFEKL